MWSDNRKVKMAMLSEYELKHKHQLAKEFDDYLTDNYLRNVIQMRDKITPGGIRQQLFVLYELVGGKLSIHQFDKQKENGSYDLKFEYIADLIFNKYGINVRRKPNKRINVKKFTTIKK